MQRHVFDNNSDNASISDVVNAASRRSHQNVLAQDPEVEVVEPVSEHSAEESSSDEVVEEGDGEDVNGNHGASVHSD